MKTEFTSGGVWFSADAEEREAVREGLTAHAAGDRDWSRCFADAFEGLLCNGWSWLAPQDIGALTDAPLLSNCAVMEDDGTYTIHDDCGFECGVFWFPDYAVCDPLEKLRDGGKVFFLRG